MARASSAAANEQEAGRDARAGKDSGVVTRPRGDLDRLGGHAPDGIAKQGSHPGGHRHGIVVIQALLAELRVRGLHRVRAVGIGQDLPDYDEAEELVRIGRVLEAPA